MQPQASCHLQQKSLFNANNVAPEGWAAALIMMNYSDSN